MGEWLALNGGTILIIAVLVAIVAAIVGSRIRAHRAGKGLCGYSCSDCGMTGCAPGACACACAVHVPDPSEIPDLPKR